MKLRGRIESVPPVDFELIDTPLLAGGITTQPATISGTESRVLMWAAHHEKGRFYLKREQVGKPLAFVDIPLFDREYTIDDPETGVTIRLTRSKF